MIVAVTYLFHDNQPTCFLVDTNSLNQNHPFERAFKNALESNRPHTVLDGNSFNEDWGSAMPGTVTPPRRVERCRVVTIKFE